MFMCSVCDFMVAILFLNGAKCIDTYLADIQEKQIMEKGTQMIQRGTL